MTRAQPLLIEPLDVASSPDALRLLEACGLEVSDIHEAQSLYFGAKQGGLLVGVIGLELYGDAGLVRSMAVEAASRGQGIARALYRHLEDVARECGAEKLFLLTETAQGFFQKAGFRGVERQEAPLAISATRQFAALCPVSAALMSLRLTSSEGPGP